MRKEGSAAATGLRTLTGRALALLVMAVAALVLAVCFAMPAFADEADDPEVQTYTVTFVDEDGTTVLKDATEYAEGTLADAIVQPEVPTKASDELYNYTFYGWSPELADVTADATYTAMYKATLIDQSVTAFTVTFVDEDGTILKAPKEYPEGTTAAAIDTPEDPTKEQTVELTYTFDGWDPMLGPVTEDVTYTATYSSAKRQYTVIFMDDNGMPLSTQMYPYGTRAAYVFPPEDPTKPATSKYTYTFAGWQPEVTDVTGDALYIARYTATPIVPVTTWWKRLEGSNRYDTMSAIVSEGFTSSELAVLVTGSNYPDALVAASVAGCLDCPIILTKSDKLSGQAKTQLESLGVKRVHIVGGASAVSQKVLNDLSKTNVSYVYRSVWGNNRQETSLNALKFVNGHGGFNGTVVVATGYNYADALSIGPWCYKTSTPILLANKSGKLSDAQAKAAKDAGVTNVIIVGGTSAVSDKVISQLGLTKNDAKRLAGNDRYETSKAIAQFELDEGMTMEYVTVATGKNFPDALAGAALCGAKDSVLVLAKDKESVGLSLINADAGVLVGYALGGTSAVSTDLFSYLESLTA